MTKKEIKVLRKELMELIKNETDWCIENKNDAWATKDYKKGFFMGLKQMKLLINSFLKEYSDS